MITKQPYHQKIIQITLHLPISMIELLKKLASQKKVSLNTLIKTILADKVKSEYAR